MLQPPGLQLGITRSTECSSNLSYKGNSALGIRSQQDLRLKKVPVGLDPVSPTSITPVPLPPRIPHGLIGVLYGK